MKLLGYELRKAARSPELDTRPQIRANNPQGPWTPYFQDAVMRKVSGDFYEVLREGIPIIDSAIRRLISLNGTIRIIGDNAALVKELEDFCLSVPVNDTQKGIHAFLENTSNETFEQGFGLAEFIATPDMRDIAGLRVADSKQIVFRRNKDGIAEPWYRYQNMTPQRVLANPQALVERILTTGYNQTLSIAGVNEVKLNPANKLYFSINNENSDPYGVSIMRSMEFVAKILMTMQNSLMNVWERFGDPSYQVLYKSKRASDLLTRQKKINDDFNTAMTSKRAGKSADFVSAIGSEDDLVIKVIGHDNQVLQIAEPSRHVLEQIVSKTNLPAWMLGIYWSTTERMATLEVESALQDAKVRQLAMTPEFLRLFSTVLTLRGKTWKTITTDPNKPGDWGFYFETPNLRDVMAMANARFLNAQADMMERGGQTTPTATNVTVGQATFELPKRKHHLPSAGEDRGEGATSKVDHKCSCGKSHLQSDGAKELNRPKPWPELDKVEAEYEAELKYDWQELKAKVFRIAGLKIPSAENEQPKSAKAFSFTDDQRNQIMKALKDFIGGYELDGPDSAIKWYYGQSYSLGLIQAANMVGKERALLDILKNSEIYDSLVSDGFALVKDNATTAIKDEILAAMEDGMVQGVNPRDVASTLADLFDGQNRDWERLARTEMSGAAIRAQHDEWDERGVDVSVMLKQDGSTVAPVHPRCRCGYTISDDGNGNLSAKFAPAPDACPLCLSMQEGDKSLHN